MRRSRVWSLAATAAVALALIATDASAQAKDWKKIKIATEGAYAPWNFMDPGGKLAGFEVDLAQDLCKRLKADCEVIAQDWDGIIPALQARKYDAIMAGMNITDKRLETINFSTPYAVGTHSFLVLKKSPLAQMPGGEYSLIKDPAAGEKAAEALKPLLKGKVIGAQVSTTNSAFVEKYFKDVAEVRLYKTTEQHDLDLAAGRIDAAFAAVSYWNTVIEKPEGKDMMIAGPTWAGGILGRGVAVGVRKADPELKALFDKAIGEAIKDGALKTLSMKWFKVDMTPK
jgi:octopine/nopaline transport system substrate-binding protein